MVAQLASLVLASVLYAATASAASSDNGACAQMKSICEKAIDDNATNPWSVEACLYGASCFAGSKPVDAFLTAVYEAKNPSYTCFDSYPESKTEPRVSTAVFNAISTDKKTVTQQNFIDGFYKTLDSTQGPYPTDDSTVISYYNRITSWTSYCNGNIPMGSFIDYFQYSSTINSVYCTKKRDVAIPVVSKEPSCQAMFAKCVGDVDDHVFSESSCTLCATCFDGPKPVAAFLTALSKQISATAPLLTALTQQRLTHDLFEDWTHADDEDNDNPTLSEQNFIDAWYSELKDVGGPYPNSTDIVVEYFDRIAAWAGFCDEGIPYNNTADYFQFSPTVNGTDSS